MRRTFLYLTCVLLLGACHQPPAVTRVQTGETVETSFQKVIGGADVDRGVFVSALADGGYAVAGLTRTYGEGQDDIYFVRTDLDGETMWTRTYGGPGSELGWSVQATSDGFRLAGMSNSFGAGGYDCYLVATDADGNLEWSKTFGGPARDRCWALVQTSDGGSLLAGETQSFGEGEEDCYLIKTDISGNEEWSTTFGGAQSDRCFSVAPTEDGGFLVIGQTFSEGAGDRDAWAIKTNAAGDMEWSKTFGGSASDVAHYVAPTADGQFLITGYTTSLAVDDDDPFLIKIDASGEVAWTRVIPMEGLNHTITGAPTKDGTICLGGFSEYGSTNAGLLAMADSDGNLIWSKDILRTGTGRSLGYTVSATHNGGCVMTGQTTEQSAGDLDVLLVSLDKNGE